MARKSSLGDRRPERLRVVCKSMTAPPVVCLSGAPVDVSPLDIKWYVQAMQDAAGYVYPHDVGHDDKIGKGKKYSKWGNDSVLRYCTDGFRR